MKKVILPALILSGSIFFASCGSDAVEATEEQTAAEATVESVNYSVDGPSSELQWHGSKLAYGHTGLIDITSGTLSMEGDQLKAGKFEIDMKTIRETGNDDAESAAKLAGHLMNADFFDAEQFSTSAFEITEATKKEGNNYDIKGNLTIKGITKNISFPATVVANGEELTANAEFTINRIDWDVRYGSGVSGAIGDQIISDDIDFKVSLKAKK